jgi:kinetochore protein Mis13/DSN1
MPEIDRLLGDIMNDFSFKLAQGRVDTNVFAPPGESTSFMPIKPHPRNVENRQAHDKETAVIKK